MQLFNLPTAVFLLSTVLSTNGSPIPKCLVACKGEQAGYNTTDSMNGLHLHRSGPVHLVTREARFKVHTPGTPFPVAAPKTSTVSKITNGIKKIFSKDVEGKSEDAATLEARDPRFKVHTPGTPFPVAAPKTSTISKITNSIKKIFSKDVSSSVKARSPRFKVHTPGTPFPVAAPKTSTVSMITNGIKKLFSKSVATEESPAAEEPTIQETPIQESAEELVEGQEASQNEESAAEQEAGVAEDEKVAN